MQLSRLHFSWISFVLLAMFLCLALATPSLSVPSEIQTRDGERYDDWDLCRTRAGGADGFFQITAETYRPAIVFESLGDLADIARSLGENFAEKYADRYQLAEQIFYYVRNRVTYTSDLDQFDHEEFAQNADELARTIELRGSGKGDCEDYAILLAVLYKAAGFRSGVVLAPGHAATLVHLPGYGKANLIWKFKGSKDWIWAEATGKNNPLGWTPPEFASKKLVAYEIRTEEPVFGEGTGAETISAGKRGIFFGASPFFSMIFLLWILSAFRRR